MGNPTTVNRIAAGKSTGGQYTYKTNTESDVTLDSDEVQKSLHEVIRSSDNEVNLAIIDDDEYYTDDEINDALGGKWDKVSESVYRSIRKPRYTAAYNIACEEADAAYAAGAFHKSSFDLDEDEVNEAVREVLERDTASPVDALLSQTPPQVMRSPLGQPADRMVGTSECFNGDWAHDEVVLNTRLSVVSGMLSEHGVNSYDRHTYKAIRDLVVNGPTTWHKGVKLDVIWRGNVSEATVCPPDNVEAGWREVTFDGPDVLILDPVNGEGHVVTIPSSLRQTLTPDRPAFLDRRNRSGYGWTAVSDYKPQVTHPRTTDWI